MRALFSENNEQLCRIGCNVERKETTQGLLTLRVSLKRIGITFEYVFFYGRCQHRLAKVVQFCSPKKLSRRLFALFPSILSRPQRLAASAMTQKRRDKQLSLAV